MTHRAVSCRFLAVWALVSSLVATSLAAQSPTAVIGNDLDELQKAVDADPQNLGVRMRHAMRLFERIKEREVGTREAEQILKDTYVRMEELRKLEPGFPYPYRVLAKRAFRSRDYRGCLAVIGEFSKVGRPDSEMRLFAITSMVELARDAEKPAPEMLKEAATYIADWVIDDAAPAFGTLFGLLKTWTNDDRFRDELVRVFEERYKKDPSDFNLAISWSSILIAIGRNESAWNVVHAAEQKGLCDWTDGARHPMVYILNDACSEIRTQESIDAVDTVTLCDAAKRFPENASLTFRAALALKSRGFSNSRQAKAIELRVSLLKKRDANFDATSLLAVKDECEKTATRLYGEALPFAEKAAALNPKLQTTPLVIGDLLYKLGRGDEAVAQLKQGVENLPLYMELREGFANVLRERKEWKACAEQLVESCRRNTCKVAEWDKNAPDSLLPKPKSPRERMLVELMEDKDARQPVIEVFAAAAAKDPKNPNLFTYLAMLHYFAGEKEKAVAAMRRAEAAGMCAQSGYEFELATLIASRTNW